MGNLSLVSVFRDTWNIFKENILFLLVGSVLSTFLLYKVSGLLLPCKGHSLELAIIGYGLLCFSYTLVMLGWLKIFLDLVSIGTSSYLQPLLDGPANTANTLDTWGWQLEAGSVATPFQTATGTIQGELAACQRYYWRTPVGPANGTHGVGMAYSTTGTSIAVPLPVQMRFVPTSVDFASLSVYDTGTITAVTGLTLNGGQTSYNTGFVNPTVASGLTQYRTYFLFNTNSNGYIGFNAEL